MIKHTLLAILAAVLMAGSAIAATQIIEDFEDGDITDYTSLGPRGAVNASYAHDGSFGLGPIPGSGFFEWIYRTDVTLSQGNTFSAWVKFIGTPNGRAYFGFGASSAGTLSIVLGANTGTLLFQENNNFGFRDLASAGQSYAPDTWYRVEVVWGLGGSLLGNLYASDGTTLLNSINASSTLFSTGGIAFREFSGAGVAFDTVERVLPDADGDGVSDDVDLCPATPAGATVDAEGCSIADLCPCENPWKNHGAYVSCVARTAEDFVAADLITEAEKDAIVSEAAQSSCGDK